LFTDKYKLNHLFRLLDDAEKLANQFTGGYSNQFRSAEEFHLALADSIAKLKSDDNEQIDRLWLWFAPTCTWDDFIGLEGVNLGQEIIEILSDLKDHKI